MQIDIIDANFDDFRRSFSFQPARRSPPTTTSSRADLRTVALIEIGTVPQ